MTPCVLVVAEDPLARAGLAALLAESPDLFVAGRASGSDDFAAALQAHQPDVVLWDAGWKPEAALGAAGRTRTRLRPSSRWSMTRPARPRHGKRASRPFSGATLPPIASSLASRAASQSMIVVDVGVPALRCSAARRLPRPRLSFQATSRRCVEELTPRELQVLRLLADGLPNKAIAQRLAISEHTVKFHVNAIMGKLGVDSRTEAVVHATRLGLILL